VSIVVIAATATEAHAARRAMPQTRVVEVGVGLSRYNRERFDTAIVCGVAGGLRPGVLTGTVVVASKLGRPDGSSVAVDASLCDRLADAARSLGFDPIVAPVLICRELLVGAERATWAERGYVAVEMESGGIDAAALGVIRVILDTPEHEISPQWLHPARAMLNPRLWGELVWLARNAPAGAGNAAKIVAAALSAKR
jgi:4-hydroxy-3-methylbut-2-enyl diphosphate reductase